MVGEGEEIFSRLISFYKENFPSLYDSSKAEDSILSKLSEIAGIVFQKEDRTIIETPMAHPLDFSSLPFPYGNGSVSVEDTIDFTPFEHRIIYGGG